MWPRAQNIMQSISWLENCGNKIDLHVQIQYLKKKEKMNISGSGC